MKGVTSETIYKKVVDLQRDVNSDQKKILMEELSCVKISFYG